jgi:dynein heavy chain
MESLMKLCSDVDLKEIKTPVRSVFCQAFIFAFMWSVGGNITDNSRETFEIFVRNQFEEHPDAW